MDQLIKTKESYTKKYSLNIVGENKCTTTVVIPRLVIERKADELGITPEEFVKTHKAIAHYDSFDGVFYAFKRVADGDE